MIESSRTFLWTEYARGGCGTLHSQGTDPKVWDKLPVCVLAFPLSPLLPHPSTLLFLSIHETPASLCSKEKM